MTIKQAMNKGAYLLMQIDHQKKYTSYQIVNDISETQRIVYCELNRSAFLKVKKDYKMKVKVIPTMFLNFIPFATTNKDSVPMMQFYTN